jgi:hypothetical protein
MALARRRWIVLAFVAVMAAALGRQQFGTHVTPAGQPALVHLAPHSVEALRSDFNKAASEVRVITLLAPT